MAKELLLEIGLEEMPSAYMDRALDDLKILALEKLNDNRIDYLSVNTMGTPRRLVLFIRGLEEKQEDALIEKRGPKKTAAFDAEGNPSKALQGFARGQGVEVKSLDDLQQSQGDLEIREVSGVEYVFAMRKESGSASEELLPGILLELINSLTFPKSMRWAYYNTRFARPIRWLLAIYGDKNIGLQIENIKSAPYTYGHRFLSDGAIEVKDIDHYFQLLKDNYVILDQQERKDMIWEQIISVAAEAGGIPMENDDLLEEITYLVEYPTAFFGEFSPSYLDVPPEVLTTTMIEHQRYFPVFDHQGNLLPGFIGVRNGTDFCLDIVRAGNERVLKARLEDALFFWKEDTKKPLAEVVPGLEKVLFHERMGSVLDKVKRLEKLALFISEETNLSNRDKLSRAAYLCKADLLSNMVYEFPELQGTMGRYYAIHSGEEQEICEAVYEHYLPRFAGDSIPLSETGKVLSLAEKVDNLVGFFSIGIKPTGSQDPYALRRQALGIVNIVIDANLNRNSDLNIQGKKVLARAYEGFESIEKDNGQEDTVAEVMAFVFQRMRGVLLDRGISYDVIDTVLMDPAADLNNIYTRTKSIQDFKNSEFFEDFMVVYNRSNNLSKNWDRNMVAEKVLIDDSEKDLYKKFCSIKVEVEKALEKQDYYSALRILTGLRPQIDRFFESVMVMVEEEDLKAARLGILKSIANLCNKIGDFSKIV